MTQAVIPTNLLVQGDLVVTGSKPAVVRSDITQEPSAVYPVKLTDFRVHDALQTNLPGTAAADDLALIGGTFGSASPCLETSDLKAAGATTQYARCLLELPPEYDTGETVTIRVHAGMVTTVSDGTATVAIECYESDGEAGVGSDLCTTSATSINSLTLADKDFALTSTSLAPGDVLDVRVAIAINDTSTVTAVKGRIGKISLLADIRG